MASDSTEPSANPSDIGSNFASSLQRANAEEEANASLNLFVDQIYEMPLTQLRKLAAEEKDELKREAYGQAYDFQASRLADRVASAEGYEEALREISALLNSGEIDDEDVQSLMPLVVEQARRPVPDMLTKEALPALGLGVLQGFGDLIKGAYGLAIKYGPKAIQELGQVMGQTDVPGTPVKPGEGLESVWRRWQEMKQASRAAGNDTGALSVVEGGVIQGTRETARLAQRLGRTLFSDMSDYTDEAIRERFNKDLKASKFFLAVENGTAYPELTPEDVEYIQAVGEIADLTNLVPFGVGLKAVKKGARVASALKVGAKEAAEEVETGAVRKAVGTGVEAVGKGMEKTAEVISKSPVLSGGITLVATGGDLTSASIAALSAATESGSKVVSRTIGLPGKVIRKTGEVIKTPITGPTRRALDLTKEFGLASVYGGVSMLPIAAASENPTEFWTLIGGGVGAGGVGSVTGQGVRGLNSFGQSYWAPSKPAPKDAPRATVTSYGTEFDEFHDKYANTLSTDDVNRVEALRDLIGPNNRLYVLPPEVYDSILNPAGEGTLIGTNGVANIKDSQGINTTLVRGGTESLLHETGHVILNSLTEQQKLDLYKTVSEAYGPENLQEMRKYYESLGIKLPDETALLEEVLADNFQVALNGGPLSNLGTPRSLAAKVYSLFGEIAETLRLRDLRMGGDVVTSETLQYTPSFLVQKALRNVMDAINLDEAAPVELKKANGNITRVPKKEPTEIDVGVATKVPAELIEQSPIPVAGSISGIPTPQKPPTKQRPAPAAKAGGVKPAGTLTPEAEGLLAGIDAGGSAPAFISKNLERIARDNGIEITGDMRPEDVIKALRDKKAGAKPAAPAPAAEKAPAPQPQEGIYTPESKRRKLAGDQSPPEVLDENRRILDEELNKPRAERVPLQAEYNSADVEEAESLRAFEEGKQTDKLGLTQPQRLEQRRLADAGQKSGVTNALRSLYDKVFIPMSAAGSDNVFGFSIDKVIRNIDMLSQWLSENPDVANQILDEAGYQSLSDPAFVRDFQAYLQNQANGYRGDGRDIVLPEGTDPTLVTEPTPGYEPKMLSERAAQLINSVMGVRNVTDWGAGAPLKKVFAIRLAELNGVPMVEQIAGVGKGGRQLRPKAEFNTMNKMLRDAGFDTNLFHVALENLRISRMGEKPLVRRPDLKNIKAPVTSYIQAGFMPAQAAKTSPGNPKAQESKKRTASMAVRSVAEDYMREAGLPYTPHEEYAPVNEDLAKRLADFYDQAESAPDDPEVQSAYRSLADETMAQYRAMEAAGIEIEPWEGKGEPYANSAEMLKDVRDNKHLWFFTTESGFGKGETVPNALLEDSGVVINGKPLVINDVFRAVHDYFGHAKEGYEFGPRGEFNAYLAHSRMFSDAAKPALASETLAQNSWVNFGPHLRREDGSLPKAGEEGFVSIKDRPFADQKNLVIPDELLTEADQVAGQFMPAPPVESEAFKKWFGDWEDPKAYTSRQKGPISMVTERVNGRIRPQIVYHGTSADFTEFNPTGKGVVDFGFLGAFDVERSGIFFTSDPEAASTFAQGAGGNVIPAYLDIKGPADLTTPDNIYDVIEELGLNGRVAFQAGFQPWELFDGPEGKEFVAKLKEAGYDGAQLEEYIPDMDRSVDVWVAFEPTQIKSAIGNVGTYDPTNPDIRYMPAEREGKPLESEGLRVGGTIETDAEQVFGEGATEPQFMPAPPVESEAFKNWFGDSKVVDENGVPLVVYHGGSGSPTDFTAGSDRGIGRAYFTDSPEVASKYALGGGIKYGMEVDDYVEALADATDRRVSKAVSRRPAITPAYLSITKPVTERTTLREVFSEDVNKARRALEDFSGGFREAIEDVERFELDGTDISPDRFWELADEYFSDGAYVNEDTEAMPPSMATAASMAALFPDLGFDGLIYEDQEAGGTTYVVFEPTQVKSATGNVGTYDPTNPDIRYMPAKELTTQFESTKKRGSLGGVQQLVHFSSVPMKTLDPKKSSGEGAATPTDLRGAKRGYFYRLKKGAYESGIADRPYTYMAQVDGNSIYDLAKDPLGYRGIPDREKADQMLIDAGFAGMRGKVGAIDMVAMFKPVKVTEATAEDVYTKKQLAEQRRQRAPLEEEEIDYQAEDEAWEAEKARRWPSQQFMPAGPTGAPGVSELSPTVSTPLDPKLYNDLLKTVTKQSEGKNLSQEDVERKARARYKARGGKYTNVVFSLLDATKTKASLAKNVLDTDPQRLFDRLDAAKEQLATDPARLASPAGFGEYMKAAGMSGDVLAAPPMLDRLLNRPAEYVDLLRGGYHGDRTKPGTLEAADVGLDATVRMAEAINGRPPELVTALHSLWGILSRMLAPIHQEAMWLRLVSSPEVMSLVQASVDGNFTATLDEWKDSVRRAKIKTDPIADRLGNPGVSNANAFYLMLTALNGKWDRMSDVYASETSTEMGRKFWSLGLGKLGIRNKVQRFIGLTFGIPSLIMDRWKFVEFYFDQFGKAPQDYFVYDSGNTPEDPNGIYSFYGPFEGKNNPLSLAMYEGFELALNEAIKNSSELRDVLGRHANLGGLHWKGWNAIKNEAVGHSSLDLTYDLVKKSQNPTASDVLALVKEKEYYTEGLVGTEIKRFTLPRTR